MPAAIFYPDLLVISMDNQIPQDFFSAIKNGDLETIKQLLEIAGLAILSTRDERGISAVLTAAYYRQPIIAHFLISNGAGVNLFEACAVGSTERVQLILAEKPDLLNEFSPDGFQPIGLAAFFGHSQIVSLLLNLGAQVDIPSRNAMAATPLNSATAGGAIDICKQLLEHGANPNTSQADNFVPLHAAAQNGHKELTQLLLNFGANKALRNSVGKTALDLAKEYHHPELFYLLT
jgi:ankyrin repeat protein